MFTLGHEIYDCNISLIWSDMICSDMICSDMICLVCMICFQDRVLHGSMWNRKVSWGDEHYWERCFIVTCLHNCTNVTHMILHPICDYIFASHPMPMSMSYRMLSGMIYIGAYRVCLWSFLIEILFHAAEVCVLFS